MAHLRFAKLRSSLKVSFEIRKCQNLKKVDLSPNKQINPTDENLEHEKKIISWVFLRRMRLSRICLWHDQFIIEMRPGASAFGVICRRKIVSIR
jgi:hypothetical protein